ncbi:hypothetical protein WUBG_10370 [Wuchereria bancrofti]|uniref:Uncharacterized protein n=1 Tax=Wuchereria bancrofti TaxID=6293 RepID=J9ENW2_WUCBA|nr:hypothetical protein WUBG_10370 [Wuchereria bancrofti]
MSILEKIRKARENLRAVETTVTMEDGTVVKEKRSSKGDFVYTGEDDRSQTGDSGSEKEVQELEVTFKKESGLGDSQKAYSASHISLSNRQMKNRLYRQALGYIVDLKPDLQMANVAKGIYLGR